MRSRLIALFVPVLLGWPIAPSSCDKADAEAAATEFVAAALPGAVVEGGEVGGPSDDLYGRSVYSVYYGALRLPQGQAKHVLVTVHATRPYVCDYSVHIPAQEGPAPGVLIGSDQAGRTARELVAACFPNWGEELRFSGVRGPTQAPGGLAQFVCGWEGWRDGIRTGDWAAVYVGTDGLVRSYLCNAAVMHTRGSVRVTKERALEVARAFIARRATFDMAEVSLSVELVLSQPIAPNEGPVWDVFAKRPPPADGWAERVFRLYVDGISGRPIPSVLGESFGQSSYFFSNW